MDSPFSTPFKPKPRTDTGHKSANPDLDSAFIETRMANFDHNQALATREILKQRLSEKVEERKRLKAEREAAKEERDSARIIANEELANEIECAQNKYANSLQEANQAYGVKVKDIDRKMILVDKDLHVIGLDLGNNLDAVNKASRRLEAAHTNLIVVSRRTKQAVSIMTACPPFSAPPAQRRKKSSVVSDPIEPTTIASSIAPPPKEVKLRRSKRIQSKSIRSGRVQP